MMDYGYQPHTKPFAHQAVAFGRSARKRVFALFMDPGTGKSKIVIDTAAYLYLHGKITALLVVAPNDVDDQWIEQEIPRHLPPRIQYRAVCWQAHSAKQRRLSMELATRPLPRRLAVLAINHEAFATASGRAVVIKFLKTYTTLFALDEGHAIKSLKAARTRWMVKLGEDAFAKRILTGTPITKNPLDLYPLFKFLDIRIIGFDSPLAFKHEYADWITEYVQQFNKRAGKKILRNYESLQGFKNLDKLYARIDPYIHRQSKEECLDLPPKMYSILQVSMSQAQLELYNQVKANAVVLLEKVANGEPISALQLSSFEVDGEGIETELIDRLQSSEGRISAQIKLVTQLRCRQIVGGFITTDAGEVLCIDGNPGKIPRFRTALTWLDGVLQGSTGKVIIWARFRAELKALYDLIKELGIECVLVYGGGSKSQRKENIAAFKDRENPLRIMLSHEQSLGVGMDFPMANNMLFYSSSHSYYQRTQAEDRAHRIGQQGTVTVTDLFAREVGIDRLMAEARATAQAFNMDFMHYDLKGKL